ncbi:glycosyltransferase family 31 protein [Serpula lacrymans var. lacrymans S7.3]|uniref:Glycosyltransferase family 31 protein n=2 Tax=Serpula lacrymans var. lacrymans TaxID=341189 RepID=F8PXQ0_SERL3|nr:glycosyltransferase family 31 protein [Serpula lacrymans var. lacrymans S7.9]EGN98663.1 glycosyltransferase family 31 protein [Serpula lacrymans var. lacrymans S7.3]EGO24267.1 glycosyltransferase family 31 protein [Serpula lacrymans var. lacrymans S7.9]
MDNSLLGNADRQPFPKNARKWWNIGETMHKGRSRDGKRFRNFKIGSIQYTILYQHPPLSILFALLIFTVFAITLTLSLKYILNPDREPLPWQAYCSIPSSTTTPPMYRSASPYPYLDLSSNASSVFLPHDLDCLPPTGIFLGVFSMDTSFERRMLIRTTWASHPRSRNGAGDGDQGLGTSRTVVRFIIGRPRKDWERRIQTEIELYHDIVILPITENMNSGKTHSYFTWAASSAWVPPNYFNRTVSRQFSYSNATSPEPLLAHHDPAAAWEHRSSGQSKPWVRPDYVAKVDDDAFVMLAELESRLRLELYSETQKPYGAKGLEAGVNVTAIPTHSSSDGIIGDALSHTGCSPLSAQSRDPLVYWGYLVKERFMAGELYALTWSLTEWVSVTPAVKALSKGAEDKQTAKWMALHPRSNEIRWSSERCWIYDHPRSGTVYSHGFLFPSEVTRIRQRVLSYIAGASSTLPLNVPIPTEWSLSSVSTFGVRYSPPLSDMSLLESVEALVEGSHMSRIREDSTTEAEIAWSRRESRNIRYENKRVGGTVVVHFVKKHMWFLETALAMLDDENYSDK